MPNADEKRNRLFLQQAGKAKSLHRPAPFDEGQALPAVLRSSGAASARGAEGGLDELEEAPELREDDALRVLARL